MQSERDEPVSTWNERSKDGTHDRRAGMMLECNQETTNKQTNQGEEKVSRLMQAVLWWEQAIASCTLCRVVCYVSLAGHGSINAYRSTLKQH